MSEADEESQRYDFELHLDRPGNVHAIQFGLVPEGSFVLDVGCHTGIMGNALIGRKRCRVVGIDQDEAALRVAATRLERVANLDIEQPDWASNLLIEPDEKFDVILFGDVLEHTRNPGRILREARTLLKPDGRVIVSVPNVANLRVRLGLLKGNFNYEESGILDRTHLRFFTRKTARELLEQAGFRIAQSRVAGYSLPHWLIRKFPGMLGVQFIQVGIPRSVEK